MFPFSKANQSIWLIVKSPSGTEEYIPKLLDIPADTLQQYKDKWRRMKCLLSILFLLLILLIICIIIVIILLPILLIQHKSTIIIQTNTTTILTPILITTINCIFPNVYSPLGICVNVLIDSNNCGTIGNICPTNSSCSAGACDYVPGVQLPRPHTIWSAAINGSADDQIYRVILPWNVTLYDTTTNRVVVSTDGVLCLGHCSTAYTETMLPSNVFLGATAFPFWDDLYIYANTSQGIYYQSEGNSPNRTLTFEYYMSHYLASNEYYHFQIVFFENATGVVIYKYFDATDRGDTCTIGVQASGSGPFILYSYDEEGAVQQNMTLLFDTNSGTFNRSTM